MLHVKVPLINGEMDIDYRGLIAGFQLSEGLAFVQLKEGAEVRESWELSTEEEFNALKPVIPDPPPPEPTPGKLFARFRF